MIRINNISMKIGYTEAELEQKIKKILHVPKIKTWSLFRRSIDSRKKNDIHYVISVDVSLMNPSSEAEIVNKVHNNSIMSTNIIKYHFPYRSDGHISRPVIIGAGPAGYFAALKLAEAGFCPIVFERGRPVEDRKKDVEHFWETGELNLSSNVSFGEGGAGTFSDGKLNTGIKDPEGRIRDVLECFHSFGADKSILYDAKPHVGTDILKTIMENMRRRILSCGGEIHFESFFSDFSVCESSKDENNPAPLYKIIVRHGDPDSGSETLAEYFTHTLILAIGHSARDTFQMLYENGLKMEQKPFAIGLRIEHKREDINKSQYGADADFSMLPSADYKLTYHTSKGRSVFSFCMCPGGYVVNASSETGGMVVNGMSYSKRDADNSNSAIVCNILPSDYTGEGPLDGVIFQQRLERAFYQAGNGLVPVQTYGDFKEGKASTGFGGIKPCIKGGFSFADLKEHLPEFVSDAIIEAIDAFGKKIKGFDRQDAVLSGIESRTSSPVRILRNDDYMSVFPGIIPCGEGAGYAGGITSAAVDGIKAAEACAAYLIKIHTERKD